MNAKGQQIKLSTVIALAQRRKWNENTARIQFYKWRKFCGLDATVH